MKKNIKVTVRLTPIEYEALKSKCSKARVSLSEYIRVTIKDKDVYIIEGVPELLLELNRIGNNINQIARAVNYGLLTGAKEDIKNASCDIFDIKDKVFELGKKVDICR